MTKEDMNLVCELFGGTHSPATDTQRESWEVNVWEGQKEPSIFMFEDAFYQPKFDSDWRYFMELWRVAMKEITSEQQKTVKQMICNPDIKVRYCYIWLIKLIKTNKLAGLQHRLEIYDTGDGVSHEIWVDPETEKRYRVPIEIVRDFNNMELCN